MALLAALLVSGAHAQGVSATSPASGLDARSWVHESWTVKDGLPVNSINALVQDRTGYIWAATFDGLVRFDGMRFTVFNSANSEELPSNRIVGLKEGRDGALWLTTEQGHVVRFRDGRFTNIAFESGKPAGVPILLVDSLGVVWVATQEGLWMLRRDRLERVGRGTLDAPVTTILQRRDRSLWVGTIGAGVFRVTGETQVRKVVTDPAIDTDFIGRLVEDASGTLWIAGNRGLWSLRDRTVAVKAPRPLLLVTVVMQVSATGAVFAQTASGVYRVDSDPAILVSPPPVLTTGLRLWTDADAVWTVAGNDVLRNDRRVFTLPDRRTISTALFDREGSLWLGTDAGGLHRLKPALFTTYSVPEGVGYPNVYSTYVDRSGAIWLGTWGKGASRVDPVTGRATVLGTLTGPVSVNSFYEDSAGVLWIATGAREGGIYACTPPAMTCRPEAPRELGDRAVFALYGGADGRMWVGAAGLLLRYDGRKWTSFPASSGAPEAAVRAFASTRDGALWMGTNGGGLTRYRDGTFTRVTRADGLPSDLIRSLYQDADGWLWVGTEGRGLVRLDPRAWDAGRGGTKSGIIRIGSENGLFDEVIH